MADAELEIVIAWRVVMVVGECRMLMYLCIQGTMVMLVADPATIVARACSLYGERNCEAVMLLLSARPVQPLSSCAQSRVKNYRKSSRSCSRCLRPFQDPRLCKVPSRPL